MPKATITKIYNWPTGTGVTATLTPENGASVEIKTYANSPVFSQIKEGAEVEFKAEQRLNEKTGKNDGWFTEINGISAKSQKKQGGWGGGGGGGRQADEESIAAQVLLKEASALANVEFMRSKAEQISPERILEISMGLTQAYLCAYRTIKKEKSGTA
jgi:hypothetical protein